MGTEREKAIPLPAGMETDRVDQPDSSHGKRAYARMNEKELAHLFNGQRIVVKVATVEATLTGSLHNIGEGGLAVRLDQRLAENQAIKVGFFLGDEKIIAGAVVKHVQGRNHRYTAGMKFIGLGPIERQHLAGLHAAGAHRQSW